LFERVSASFQDLTKRAWRSTKAANQRKRGFEMVSDALKFLELFFFRNHRVPAELPAQGSQHTFGKRILLP
jgi:hypothetical protein